MFLAYESMGDWKVWAFSAETCDRLSTYYCVVCTSVLSIPLSLVTVIIDFPVACLFFFNGAYDLRLDDRTGSLEAVSTEDVMPSGPEPFPSASPCYGDQDCMLISTMKRRVPFLKMSISLLSITKVTYVHCGKIEVSSNHKSKSIKMKMKIVQTSTQIQSVFTLWFMYFHILCMLTYVFIFVFD